MDIINYRLANLYKMKAVNLNATGISMTHTLPTLPRNLGETKPSLGGGGANPSVI